MRRDGSVASAWALLEGRGVGLGVRLTIQPDCAFLGWILRVKRSLITAMRLHHGPSKTLSYLVRVRHEPGVGSPFRKVKQIWHSSMDGGLCRPDIAGKADSVHGAAPPNLSPAVLGAPTASSEAYDDAYLLSVSSGSQKSETGLVGLNSRCQQGCAPSGGSRGDSIPGICQRPEAAAFLGSWPHCII